MTDSPLATSDGDFGLPLPFFVPPDHPVREPEVVGEANQRPFSESRVFPSQAEPAEYYRFFDDVKDWLNGVIVLTLQRRALPGA